MHKARRGRAIARDDDDDSLSLMTGDTWISPKRMSATEPIEAPRPSRTSDRRSHATVAGGEAGGSGQRSRATTEGGSALSDNGMEEYEYDDGGGYGPTGKLNKPQVSNQDMEPPEQRQVKPKRQLRKGLNAKSSSPLRSKSGMSHESVCLEMDGGGGHDRATGSGNQSEGGKSRQVDISQGGNMCEEAPSNSVHGVSKHGMMRNIVASNLGSISESMNASEGKSPSIFSATSLPQTNSPMKEDNRMEPSRPSDGMVSVTLPSNIQLVPSELDASSNSALLAHGGTKGGLPRRQRMIADEEDKETWLDRISTHPVIESLNRRVDQISQSLVVAVMFDLMDVGLMYFTMFFNIIVIIHLWELNHPIWSGCMVALCVWHYPIMAVLLVLYSRRASAARFTILGMSNEDMRTTRCGAPTWMLLIIPCIPLVFVFDALLIFTSVAPLLKRTKLTTNFSSFMSNYNFTRFFVQYVAESVPQIILQTFIFYSLRKEGLIYFRAANAIYGSLAVTGLNVVKFSWKLWKAADEGGLTLIEYAKYLVLLKGDYQCSPGTMDHVIKKSCSVLGGTFQMNGFYLHRNKAQYGPAQQSFILINSFNQFEGAHIRKRVKKMVCAGCPMASINRIAERGLKHFKHIEILELNECAIRGDTIRVLTRAIKRHGSIAKVKVIQTGLMKRYRNRHKIRICEILKPSLELTHVAFCLKTWDEHYMAEASMKLQGGHPTLESLAIEIPERLNEGDNLSMGQSMAEQSQALLAKGEMLPSSSIAADYMYSVASILLNNGQLRSLALHNHNFNEQSIVILAKQLETNSGLTSLSLKGSRVGDGGALALARALKQNTSLANLNLRACQLHSEGVSSLSTALVENRSLISLDLSMNRVNLDGVRELARALRLNATLATLRLEDWQDTFDNEQAASLLFTSLSHNRGLTSLSLSGSALGSGAAFIMISELLQSSSTLRSLNLALPGNKVVAASRPAGEDRTSDAAAAGISSILETLSQGSCCLQHLDLRGHRLGSASLLPLSDLLASSYPRFGLLVTLDLSLCGLTDDHVAALCQGLVAATVSPLPLQIASRGPASPSSTSGGNAISNSNKLHKLEVLLMKGIIGLGMRGMRSLSDAIKAPLCGLKVLDIGQCQMTLSSDEGLTLGLWSVLANGLAVNTSLTSLGLESCAICSAPALSAISSAVALNASLTSLDLSGCKEELVRGAFQTIIHNVQMRNTSDEIIPLDLEMGEITSLLTKEKSPTGFAAVPVVRGTGLNSLKCSGEDHEIVELIVY